MADRWGLIGLARLGARVERTRNSGWWQVSARFWRDVHRFWDEPHNMVADCAID